MNTYLARIVTSSLIGLFLCLLSSCSPAQQTDVLDVVVIGGGLMGSSAAWHLSDQGASVLLVEKQDSVYTQGSSYGEARIARSNNRGNDVWSYLHNRSVQETERLIAYLNEAKPEAVHSMDDIYTTSPVTYVGRTRIYDQLMASLKRQEVDYKIAITPEEGRTTFDVRLPDSVLIQREYNPYSGTVNPLELISHLHKAVRTKGNQVSYQTKVTNILHDPASGLYEINAIDEETGTAVSFRTRKVVSAAGPYTGTLLKEIAPYFETLIDPQRVFLALFKIKPDVYNTISEEDRDKLNSYFPVIDGSLGTRDGSFFSMIEYYDEMGHPVIKIGGHYQRSAIENLDAVWAKSLTDEEIAWSETSMLRYFEILDIPVTKDDLVLIDEYSCVYSLTQTEVPYVTPITKDGNAPNMDVLVMGGMSGVGAKGAMTYGLIAANLLHGVEDADSMYQVTAKALGFERLVRDLEAE